MNHIKYLFFHILSKIFHNKEILNNFFRRCGMKIGNNCTICCNIMTAEPYFVEIGDNVTISGNVKFVTHDNSIAKIDKQRSNVFGYIHVGNNCFIGQNALILYGCELSDNIIVAAGAVVTNSFSEERIIIGGNPARKISTWDKFEQSSKGFAMNRAEMKEKFGNKNNFLKRKVKEN